MNRNEIPDDNLQQCPIPDKHWMRIAHRFNLTEREVQVAKLVCRGLSNKQIGEHLRIKDGTVKVHLRNIYGRMRVRNKVAMLLVLMKIVNETNGSQ